MMVDEGTAAWRELVNILPYVEIEGKITTDNVIELLRRLDIPFNEENLRVKAYWHKFKQFDVYSMGNQPVLFIKELWQPEFFKEVLGLHFGIHFLDRELGPKSFAFGSWKKSSGNEKPVVITTYIKGSALTKKERDDYLYALGRQYAYHLLLSMYDVDWRHLIKQQGIVRRIDYGRAFTNLNISYKGFWDIGYDKYLKHQEQFIDGVEKEFNIMRRNLAQTRRHAELILSTCARMGGFRNMFIDMELPTFVENLVSYWKRNVPFPVVPGFTW